MSNQLGAVQGWIADAHTVFAASKERLDELDRAIGDGDHGTNMARGFDSAAGLDPAAYNGSQLLRQVGMHLLGNVGGAAASLYGTLFLSLSASWVPDMDTPKLAAAVRSACDAVSARGRASVGDKTLVDPLHATAVALEEAAHLPMSEAVVLAAQAAQEAAEGTREMVARRGRAALLGQATVGHLDPGAVSMALLIKVGARHLG